MFDALAELVEREDDGQTTTVEDEPARELATRFAPTVYFDENEPWFRTDPRRYTIFRLRNAS
ncbi:hypothetical protein AUR64_03360 [Haloprofundus marisrubri]|uniref:Uncharacterized protein n=1 Tax=Haloprofundus marisrubri TaxID=1514971 RepID=A0A0W1REH0_9EURY|nr:hypothetical protein [Haloprofundus marisrubri]KTG11552.1 hypothetical protein AUR64_03360 [Haloprofundus marisrubri]